MRVATSNSPPSCNTGGTSFAPCGSGGAGAARNVIVDTISFSIPSLDVEKLAQQLLTLFPGCIWGAREPGKHGYPFQYKLLSGSLICGWLSYGAIHQKVWFYLTGVGLRVRRDRGCEDADLAKICSLEGSKLTRIDIALDVYSAKQFSVEASLAAYAAGKYKLGNAPKSPRDQCIRSATTNPLYPDARTHYVGKTKGASKYVRVYDKGLQVLGTLTPEEMAVFQAKGSLAVIRSAPIPEDAKIEEWVRVELVYLHDKRRPLTADMITSPQSYFAGGYPILSELVSFIDIARPAYIPLEEEVELARLMKACRESYGGLLYFLVHERGFDAERIVSDLIGNKSAARLMIDRETPSGWEDAA